MTVEIVASTIALAVLAKAAHVYAARLHELRTDKTSDVGSPRYLHGVRYRASADEHRALQFVEGQCEKVTSFTADELLEHALSSLIHPKDRELVETEIRKSLDAGNLYQVNYRLRTKSGKWQWVTDRGGRSTGGAIEGVLLDITDRIAAEFARVRAEERYHLLAENVEDLVCVHDGDGRFSYATPSAKRLLGFDPVEIAGKSFYVMIHPEDRERVRKQIERRVREDGETVSVRYRLRTKSGKYVHVRTQCKPAQDRQGFQTRFVTCSHDVTERTRLERELAELRGKVDELAGFDENFLTNVSHEIRTPLTSIVGFAELLQDEVAEGHRQTMETIRQSGEQLLATLASVMEFSGANRTERPRRRTNVVPLVKAEVERYRKAARAKGVQLQVVVDSDPTFAMADGEAVSRIADQLLSNAVKFTEEGCITVTVLKESGHALLRVSDTGIGISETFLPHIFEPFRQESDGLTRKYDGVGIGLSLVNRLVDGCDGRIDVDSTPARGSVFTVRLPNGQAAEMRSVTTTELFDRVSRPKSAPKPRVLAVDDNRPMRLILERHLGRHFEVRTAADGDEALGLAARERFDVVVLDINLGTKMTGVDVLKEMRRTQGYEDASVIAITAYALPEEKSRFLEAGFDGYVAKPFTRESLLKEVERVTRVPVEAAA